MASRRVSLTAIFWIGLIAFTGIASSLGTSPAFGQGAIVEVITKLIQEQQALAQRRREEVAALKRMQFGLKTLGYYDGPIDGDFGPETATALSTYRRSVGRSESGLLSFEEVAEIENQASEQLATQPQAQLPAENSQATGPYALVRADVAPSLDAKLSNAAAWIIVASRLTPEEALEVAGPFVRWFASTMVIRSSNGRYAVLIGWLNKEQGRSLKDTLISKGLIPP